MYIYVYQHGQRCAGAVMAPTGQWPSLRRTHTATATTSFAGVKRQIPSQAKSERAQKTLFIALFIGFCEIPPVISFRLRQPGIVQTKIDPHPVKSSAQLLKLLTLATVAVYYPQSLLRLHNQCPHISSNNTSSANLLLATLPPKPICHHYSTTYVPMEPVTELSERRGARIPADNVRP